MPDMLARELRRMEEKQIIALVRDTVTRLETLGDRLEEYVSKREPLSVGFEVEDEPVGKDDEKEDGQTDAQP
jgi:hypothetical protein